MTKIYLNRFLERDYATINEILLFLKKTYCSTIGIEFMHISDPDEKTWLRALLVSNKITKKDGITSFLE